MMQNYKECPIEKIVSLSSIYTFSLQTFEKGHKFLGEAHDFIELVIIKDGMVGVTADKSVYTLSAGQMIVHPAGEFHAIWSDMDSSPTIIVLSFSATAFPDLKRRIFNLSANTVARFYELFESAEQIFNFNGVCVNEICEGKEYAAASLVTKIEHLLLHVFAKKGEDMSSLTNKSADNYAQILSYLEEHLGEPLTVEEIARANALSVPTLERTVDRYAHCGALAYFHGLKQQRAQTMLLEGRSVKDVSLSLGFSNQNYFSLWFKKRTGISPSTLHKK